MTRQSLLFFMHLIMTKIKLLLANYSSSYPFLVFNMFLYNADMQYKNILNTFILDGCAVSSDILNELLQRENRVLHFWTMRKRRLDQCQQYVVFERSAKQVCAYDCACIVCLCICVQQAKIWRSGLLLVRWLTPAWFGTKSASWIVSVIIELQLPS